MPNRRDALKGAAALSSLLLASCSDRGSQSSAGGASPGMGELTELERKFGFGPSTPPANGKYHVKLRPDVHLVEQGPAAVRSVAPNGLSWVLDPKITGPIETGRVLLVTNRCAGRVLATRPAGDHVEVVLGPAQLEEYLLEADIEMSQPVDFSQAVMYEAPDYPGAIARVGGQPPPAAWNEVVPRASHAVWTQDHSGGEFLATQLNQKIKADPRFKVTPVLDLTSLGVNISSTNDVIQMVGDMRLRFSAPRLEFKLGMEGGKIVTAVRLVGAAALIVTFRAHSNHGVNGNIKTRHFVPVDCTFARFGGVIPFAATMRHVFLLETAFSSKGNVDATGQYVMEGALQMTFGGTGLPKVSAPTGFEVQRSLVKSVSGVTMGPAGLILAHQVRCIVGLGGYGFVVGPYVGLTTTASVTKGSSGGMMSEQCREAILRMSMHGGLGYQIPEGVANAINTVLSVFHIGGIPAAGGISTPDYNIVNNTEHYPDLNACRTGGAAT